MDGAPLASGRREAPASHTAERGTAGVYRPRYEVVAGQILELISELAMRPGDRLPTEKNLAERLGTSRSVVRDAVKILSASGRVSAQKGRGLYVADGESVIGLHGLGGHAAAAVEEHEAIYRAIRDGEPEAAAEATSVHLDNTLEDYHREIRRRVFG